MLSNQVYRLKTKVPEISLLKNKSKYFFSFVRLLAHTACLGLFVYLTMDIYSKFKQELTSVGIRSQAQYQTTKELPCITVCPWEAFKRQGLFYNKEVLDQATLEKEAIFFHNNVYQMFNESIYSIKEIRSVIYGRCFRVCYMVPVGKNEEFYVMFNKDKEMKGFSFLLIKIFKLFLQQTSEV